MDFLRKWGLVGSWCGLIFILSSLQVPPPTGNLFFDVILPDLAHLVEYGVLFILIWRASKKVPFSFLMAIVYAFSDEWHQSFVPTRTLSLMDVLVDFLGMTLAWLAIWKLLPRMPARLKNWVSGSPKA